MGLLKKLTKPVIKKALPEVRTMWNAGTIMSGGDFMRAAKTGVLVQPSVALSRAGTGFPIPEAYAKRLGEGYPDVVIRIPEAMLKGNPKAVWSTGDLGSPTLDHLEHVILRARQYGNTFESFNKGADGKVVRSLVDLPAELQSGSLADILSTEKGREAFGKFRDQVAKIQFPSTAKGMVPTGDATGKIVNGQDIPGSVPKQFEEIATGMYSDPYGEIKVLGDVKLDDIWSSGHGVIIRPPRIGNVDPAKAEELEKYLRSKGTPFKKEDAASKIYGSPAEKEAAERLHREEYDALGNSFSMISPERTSTMAASKGGKASGEPQPTDVPEAPAESSGGPRIVINPSTFRNEKDAMCVAWNEALRIVMEETGFEPVSEPTEEQRRFFADTDYADDELQLRRTILARICTFDTSVKDPTDEQVQEAVEFVRSVMEGGFPRNEWEQSCLKKILDVLSSVPTAPNDGSPMTPIAPEETPEEPGAMAAELGGQTQEEDLNNYTAGGAVLTDPRYDAGGPAYAVKDDRER